MGELIATKEILTIIHIKPFQGFVRRSRLDWAEIDRLGRYQELLLLNNGRPNYRLSNNPLLTLTNIGSGGQTNISHWMDLQLIAMAAIRRQQIMNDHDNITELKIPRRRRINHDVLVTQFWGQFG
ncbi:MAG: hypothetical protein LH660_02035 [Phormidesmis sp. CAN_BIN36]|nr:hypothetical protein [Phormidesmis sp. CAN_BIN36]